MKKILIMTLLTATAVGAYARPCGPGWHHPGPPPPPPPHHHGGFWGRGGCNFWPGFVGGVIGGAVATRVVAEPAPVVVAQPAPVVVTPAPVVVTQPVVTQPVVTQPVVTTPVVTTTTVAAPVTQMQNVWVEGRYVDQVQANGTVTRIWNPGHYEQRTVVVQ